MGKHQRDEHGDGRFESCLSLNSELYILTFELMICPFCKYDYRDVEEDEMPGGVVRVDDHFYKTYRRLGRRCPHCGKVAEFIERPTGSLYFKRFEQKSQKRKRSK